MLYATTSSEDEAVKIADHLLRKRLVACANIFNTRSLYSWRGEIHDDSEYALIMKTSSSRVKKAIEEAAKLHSHKVPCLVSYSMEDGLPAYLKWIDSETTK